MAQASIPDGPRMPANPTMALCAGRAVATSYMATRAPAAASHDHVSLKARVCAPPALSVA